MERCQVCGNEYDKVFTVTVQGRTHVFDSFECAIRDLAPVCEHCGVKIIGHGFEADDRFFCSHHCAEVRGVLGMSDRV